MKTKLILLFLLFFSLLASSKVINVRTDTSGDFSSVEMAVKSSNDGDTIDVLGVFTESLLINSSVASNNLTILGHGADKSIIQQHESIMTVNSPGTAKQGVISISDGKNIVFKNLAIQNGSVTETFYGGGVLINQNTGAKVVFYGCEVRNNLTARNGAGFAIIGSNVDLINCFIHHNESYYNTNQTYGFGGGVYFVSHNNGEDCTLNISGCTISNNTVFANGAGVFADGNGVSGNQKTIHLNMINTTVYANATKITTAAGNSGVFLKASELLTNGIGSGISNLSARFIHVTIANNSTAFANANAAGLAFFGTSPVFPKASFYNSIIANNIGGKQDINFASSRIDTLSHCIIGRVNEANIKFKSNTLTNVKDLKISNQLRSSLVVPFLPLVSGSVAIDYIVNNYINNITKDQTGSTRDNLPDAGSYEFKKVESIMMTIDKQLLDISKKDTARYSIELLPIDADSTNIELEFSKPNVLISSDDKIIPFGKGVCSVKAYSIDNYLNKSNSIEIEVLDPNNEGYTSGVARFTVCNVIQDNMVVQQGKPFKVWGYAPNGKQINVTASWYNLEIIGVANENNQYVIEIPVGNVDAGDFSKHWLRVTDGEITYNFQNILIGEVWFFAGQSNMNMTLKPALPYHSGILNYQDEIANANYLNIRLLRTIIQDPANPVDTIKGNWVECTSTTAADFSAVAYVMGEKLYKELNIPIGLIVSAKGAMSCQSFTPYETLLADPLLKEKYLDPYLYAPSSLTAGAIPCILYNGIIHPFRNLSIAGFGWYQGENNAGDKEMYTRLNAAMVNAWRNVFNQGNLPFYYVQMTPYAWGGSNFYGGGYYYFREAQEAILSVLPNSGMVVTMDIGTPENVHPTNKRPVGERMAGLALHYNYNDLSRVVYGPRMDKVTFDKYSAEIEYHPETIGEGINTNDGLSPRYFYLAGENRVFYPANANIVDDKIRLNSEIVENPVAVRYAFLTYPVTNFQNDNGLPAHPFRTDNWDNATYSEIVNTITSSSNQDAITYSLINNQLYIKGYLKCNKIGLRDITGKLIWDVNVSNQSGEYNYSIPNLQKGIYLLFINNTTRKVLNTY